MARRARSARLIAALALAAAVLTVPGPGPQVAGAVLAPQPEAATGGGLQHRCAVVANKTVRCWGANDVGQLGNGTTVDSTSPVVVQGLSDVVAMDAGLDFSCALTASGTVGCWGRNTSGSLGDPGAGAFETTPTFGNGLTDVEEIVVGATHACARLASGQVRCWGDNDDEQLGDGTSTDSPTPVAVVGLNDAVQISAGFAATCAVRTAGTLTCWGANPQGMWGNGTTTGSPVPVDIGEAGPVAQVEVGFSTTCVIDLEGFAHCAGGSPLGDGTSGTGANSTTFVAVDLPPVLDISVGGEICAIVPDASVWCFGSAVRLISTSGAIGFTDPSSAPRPVAGLDGVTVIDAADAHTCAGTIDGRLSCWGLNVGGELQIDPKVIEEPGVAVPGVQASEVSVSTQACAVTLSSAVECWGASLAGLTVGDVIGEQLIEPTVVPGVGAASDVDSAVFHSCAVRTGGAVVCWGINIAGQLGFPGTGFSDPDDIVVTEPVVVAGVSNQDSVATGFATTCSTTVGIPNGGGGVSCWGAGESGQLGTGATPQTDPTPAPVVAPFNTIEIDMLDLGANHACGRFVISFFGEFVYCWGANGSGQLGDGTTNDSATAVSTLVGAPKAVAVGTSHSCAIDFADSVRCWGRNDHGQVGTGSTVTPQTTPQLVAGLPGTPVGLAAGADHTCALILNGEVWCWGDNTYRQTGLTVSSNVLTPTKVPGLSGIKEIAAGQNTTCAIRADDTVTCWGDNNLGTTGRSPIVFTPSDMGIGALSTPAALTTEPIFRPVVPARLLETRSGLATVDGAANGDGIVRGGTQIEIPVAGRAGIPDDAAYAVVNTTAVQPASGGFFTVHGCLSPRPVVASLNYSNQGGDGPINLGNESIVELSPNGSICLFTSSTTHATIDVTAYGTLQGGYESTTPARILETRADKTTIDGEFQLDGPLQGGTEVELQVVGRAGIDENAEAAVMYIAAVTPTGVGFVTAHPCLADRPLASSLNYSSPPGGPGINRGNEVIAPLSDDGTVCLYVSTTTHLTVDVMGSTSAATTYETVAPARILETRNGEVTVDGVAQLPGPLAPMQQIEVQVGGRAGVGGDASFAVVNLTGVQPAGTGFVTGHPCEPELPLASSLNVASPPVSGPINGGNEVLLPLSSSGSVCLYVSQSTNLTLDVVGSS